MEKREVEYQADQGADRVGEEVGPMESGSGNKVPQAGGVDAVYPRRLIKWGQLDQSRHGERKQRCGAYRSGEG
jgi:hypothetical protein